MENKMRNRKSLIILAVVVIVLFSISLLGKTIAQNKIDDFLASSDYGDIIKYDSVSYNPLTLTPTLNDVEIQLTKGEKLAFDSISIHKSKVDKDDKSIDIAMSYTLKNLPLDEVPTDLRKLLVQPAMYGLSSMAGTGDIKLEVDEENLTIVIDAGIDDLASIRVELASSYDYDELGVEKTIEALQKGHGLFALLGLVGDARRNIYIDSFTFDVNDKGFLQQKISEYTEKEDYSAEQNRRDIERFVHKVGLAKPETEESEEIGDEMMDFMSSPNALSISISPDKAMSFKEISGVLRKREAYKKLNMTISG